MKYSIGLDLGGTKLASGLVDHNGKILSYIKNPVVEIKQESNPRKSQKHIIDLMVQAIQSFRIENPKAFNKKSFVGIGLACAGPLNVKEGCLVYPVNFPHWKIVPILQMLKDALKKEGLHLPVSFQNDAVSSAYAEGWVGHAKNLTSYAVVTIGTGIGTGVIFNKKPVQTHGMGSEFGHILVQENAVKEKEDLHKYTVEGIASGTGLLRRAREILNFQGSTTEELITYYEKDPSTYQFLFDDMADALAALCYNLSIGFNLEKIFLSGGLIKVRHLYMNRLKNRYSMLVKEMNPLFLAPIMVAKTKNMSGVVGAARLPYGNATISQGFQ